MITATLKTQMIMRLPERNQDFLTYGVVCSIIEQYMA